MLPSPSLAPPLLSASPSPPPFCGIPPAAGFAAGVEVLGAAEEDEDEDGGGELDELEELDEPEPPHPASARPTTVRARAATLQIDLLGIAVSITGTSRSGAATADVLPRAQVMNMDQRLPPLDEGQDVLRTL
jgi:hypothetical protein